MHAVQTFTLVRLMAQMMLLSQVFAQIALSSNFAGQFEVASTGLKQYQQVTDLQTHRTLCALDPPFFSLATTEGHCHCAVECANRPPCVTYSYHWDTTECELFDEFPLTFTVGTACVTYQSTNINPTTPRFFDCNPILLQQNDGSTGMFDQTWNTFKAGFRINANNFWLGNELIHRLTLVKRYKLRLDLKSAANGKWYYAEFDTFAVADETHHYTVNTTTYNANSSSAGNSLYMSYWLGMPFTTKDQDNTHWGPGNCAGSNWNKAGFWYGLCAPFACLNCQPGVGDGFVYSTLPPGQQLAATKMWLVCT